MSAGPGSVEAREAPPGDAAHGHGPGDRGGARRCGRRRDHDQSRRQPSTRPAGRGGKIDTGVRLAAAEVERIIRIVASSVRAEVHAGRPVVSAELPETGERFEGILPPVSTAPCFSIRKPAIRVISLEDYVSGRHPVSRCRQRRSGEPSRAGATSPSPAGPVRARRRSPTRSWPSWPGSTSG